jgi:hypothetical protein
MSEVDALFRLLTDAPPRSAEIVKRVALAGMDFPEVGKLYGVDVPRAQVLVFRAMLDVVSGGTARVPDAREAAEVAAMVGPSPERSRGTPGPLVTEPSMSGQAGSSLVLEPFDSAQGERGREARKIWNQIAANKDELKERLGKAALEFADSPDRVRDEWLRRIAIVVVIALTAFFYWREQTKPHPPPQKRPITLPTSSPPGALIVPVVTPP